MDTRIIVKSVIPQIGTVQMVKAMKQVFDQYDVCKRTPGNPEREGYAKEIEDAVNRLSDKEKEVIKERYMVDSYRMDYQVYNFHLTKPISKDTFTKIRNNAFAKLYISLSDKGILKIQGGGQDSDT
ncbi:hypothetical protein [Paenibacillus lautus]|uniref:hypothetical protein n=1 Tax=Paenibacillus lautus TaxID=1401 RepID=UPI003D2A3955